MLGFNSKIEVPKLGSDRNLHSPGLLEPENSSSNSSLLCLVSHLEFRARSSCRQKHYSQIFQNIPKNIACTFSEWYLMTSVIVTITKTKILDWQTEGNEGARACGSQTDKDTFYLSVSNTGSPLLTLLFESFLKTTM